MGVFDAQSVRQKHPYRLLSVSSINIGFQKSNWPKVQKRHSVHLYKRMPGEWWHWAWWVTPLHLVNIGPCLQSARSSTVVKAKASEVDLRPLSILAILVTCDVSITTFTSLRLTAISFINTNLQSFHVLCLPPDFECLLQALVKVGDLYYTTLYCYNSQVTVIKFRRVELL